MKTYFIVAVLVVLATLLQSTLQASTGFPRIMWNYWHNGEKGMTLFTRMCVNNHRHYAQKAGIQFRLVNQTTLPNYVDTNLVYSTFRRIPQQHQSIQKLVDLIRFQILIKYGGMWIDADSYFIRDLSWYDNPHSSSHFINKVSDFPDIILPSYYPQRTQNIVHDEQKNIDIEMNYAPGCEFIIAMPQSRFLLDHWDLIDQSLTLGKEELEAKVREEGARFDEQETGYMHTWLSVALETLLLWRKENQLKLTNSTYNNVFEYYNLWLVDSLHNHYVYLQSYQYFANFQPVQADITWLPAQHSLQKWTEGLTQRPLFIKFISEQRRKMDKFINRQKLLTCFGWETPIVEDSQLSVYLIQLFQNYTGFTNQTDQALFQPCSQIKYRYQPSFIAFALPAVLILLVSVIICRLKPRKTKKERQLARLDRSHPSVRLVVTKSPEEPRS